MGIKSIPIEAFPSTYWRMLEGQPDDNNPISVQNAYKQVPVMKSAIQLRANSVASFPYSVIRNGEDVTHDQDMIELMRTLRPLLKKVELNLCIYGHAYLLIEKNKYGINQRMRSLMPRTIKPIVDQTRGLIGFNRVMNEKTYEIQLDEVIYFWTDNIDAEIGHGVSDAETAMRAASTLYFLDTFLENFWKRGAIKATLLTVGGATQQAEIEKLEAWWKRFISGVKNAWQSVGIRADVKPVVIGDTLKDTVNPDLTEQSRTDVLTALGVPHSLVLSNAATYATAQVDRLGFYENTVYPEALSICNAINDQYFSRFNIRIVPVPNKLETYQRNEIDKAQGVIQLTGSPILTVNEARDMMGYGPIQEAPMNIDDKFDTPEEIINATAPAQQQPQTQSADAIMPSEKSVDLSKWRSKSLKQVHIGKNANVKFVSETIPEDEQFIIREQLANAKCADEVSLIFGNMKRVAGSGFEDDERELYDMILSAMNQIKRQLLAETGQIDVDKYAKMLADKIAEMLNINISNVYSSKIEQEIIQHGIGVDPSDLAVKLAPEWNAYIAKRKAQLEDTTRRYLSTLVGANTPITSRVLDVAFGDRRAEIIATTEYTNMSSMVTMKMQEYLKNAGLDLNVYWQTQEDEMVCSVCRSYNGKQQDVWQTPPPAHPYCRCYIVLKR
jgi:HK97 family phage portal protein